jgi:hypothetical protein
MAQVEKDEAEAGENKDEVMKRMQGDQGKPTQQVRLSSSSFAFASIEHHLTRMCVRAG